MDNKALGLMELKSNTPYYKSKFIMGLIKYYKSKFIMGLIKYVTAVYVWVGLFYILRVLPTFLLIY